MMSRLETWLMSLGRSRFASGVLLLLLVVIGYGHTLNVPFYFDDYSSILENPAIIGGDPVAVWEQFRGRFVGYITFWANYRIGGVTPFGYHLVNIFIHLSAGLAVFFFARQLAHLTVSPEDGHPEWRVAVISLAAAALFLIHPLQTQAVTYVVQRLASMGAMLYVVVLLFYVHARIARRLEGRIFWAVAALLVAAAALFTKQNTFTLPLVVVLVEWLLFGMDRKKALRLTLVGLVAAIGLLGVVAVTYHINPFSLRALDGITRDAVSGISRLDYFYLQLEGLARYFGLYLWPMDLRVDYNPPILPVEFDVKRLLLAGGHVTAIGVGLFLVRRAPLIAFGILFYYMAHLVESSVIPIKDTFVEHRMYLPSVGLSIASADLLYRGARRFGGRAALLVAAIVSVMLLSATWLRNHEWSDRLSFWEKNARLSPAHYRPWSIVAKEYLVANRPSEALMALQRASEAKSGGKSGAIRLDEAAVVTFVAALIRVGRLDDALIVIDHTLGGVERIAPLNESKLLANRGNILKLRGAIAEAEADYRRAAEVYPLNPIPWNNLAALWIERGDADRAREELMRGLSINPTAPLLLKSMQALEGTLSKE